ncbi:hypothetical protein B2G46_04045, partial [Limosilactobacillus reuteri]
MFKFRQKKPTILPVDSRFTSFIKNVTVRLNVAGQYYITVLVESENQTLPKTSKYIGGDLGLKS